MVSKTGHFIDVDTGDRIDYHEDAYLHTDANGVPCVGEDEDGVWWGTTLAAWVLSDQKQLIYVTGFQGPDTFTGSFIGTEEEARQWAKERGIWIHPWGVQTCLIMG